MLSISTRFSIAMVVSSVVAILIVTALSMWIVLNRFNELAMERAFRNFKVDVSEYISKHGSWQQGQESEGFRHFVMHKRRYPPDAPQPGAGQVMPPPFRFMLLDTQGRILHAPDRFTVGETLPEAYHNLQRDIEVNGKLAVIAVPLGQPNLSELDRSYLDAINTALGYSLLVAATFAIIIGVLLGSGLGRSLRRLTSAIQAMKPGDLRQQVTITTKDEIGVLANAFNQMSHNLSVAYEELEQSHATITTQARQLKELSQRDELTRLHNRRYFDEHASQLFLQAKRYQRPFSVMLADIDHFKNINDSYGHPVGDEVLRTVATIMSDYVRQTDIIARYGGEEFVVAFPETDIIQAETMCERLRSLVESHDWETIQAGLGVTMSVGISADGSGETIERLLHQADQKLYQAKQAGRNQVIA